MALVVAIAALGLAPPMAIMASTGQDVLIKDGGSLEHIRAIDAVVLDKTDTSTRGKPELTDDVVVAACAATSDQESLCPAAARSAR